MQILEKVFDDFKPTDDRGPVYLEPEFADEKVKLAVVEIEKKEGK